MKEKTMVEDKIDVEKMVGTYIKLRTAIEEKKEQQKLELAPLEEQFDTVGTALLDICGELNTDSIKTGAGTVSRRVQSRYWTSDWPSMYEFIKEHDATFLLEQRIHNGNMKQFLEENPDALPMGLQADRKFVVQVRKPTNK
tara:strand:- start:690 stop:1112 length:423 start_codon:yes stop_codon:yes gene_type:complete